MKRGPRRRSDALRVPRVGPKTLTWSPRDALRLPEAQVERSGHEDRGIATSMLSTEVNRRSAIEMSAQLTPLVTPSTNRSMSW